MSQLKVFNAVIAVLVLVLALAGGCGRQQEAGPASAPGGASAAPSPAPGGTAAAPSGSPEVTLKLSLILGETSSWYFGAKRFADLVAERSGGRIKVQLYPEAQLANHNQRTELEMVQSGALDCSLESTILLSLTDQRFSVFSLPWLFADYEAAAKVCDGPAGQKMLDLLPDKGMVGLAYGVNGFRQITNSRRPVLTPDDLKGLKIRVPAIKMYISLFQRLGADPSSMNFGELFTALQQGTMDGQENPLHVIKSAKLYEVQKYLTCWDYSYDPIILCINKKRWDGLSADQQELLRQAAQEAMKAQREQVAAEEDKLRDELEQLGMEVTVLTAEQRQPFREKVEGLYQDYAKVIGADLIKQFRTEAEKAAAGAS